MARRLGSAMMLKADSMPIVYRIAYIRVKVYLGHNKGAFLLNWGQGSAASGNRTARRCRRRGRRDLLVRRDGEGRLAALEFAGRASYPKWRPVERRKLCSKARTVSRLNIRDQDRLACRWREERRAYRVAESTSGRVHSRIYKGS